MALIKCPECNGSVSDKAEICIHCGYPLEKSYAYSFIDTVEIINIEDLSDYKTETLSKDMCCISGTSTDLHVAMVYYNNKKYKECCLNLKNSHGLSFKNALVLFERIHLLKEIPESFEVRIYPDSEEYIAKEKVLNIDNNGVAFNRKSNTSNNANAVLCPRCSSTQVTTMQRGYHLILGWWGSGDPQNVCQKCGYKWTPGKKW